MGWTAWALVNLSEVFIEPKGKVMIYIKFVKISTMADNREFLDVHHTSFSEPQAEEIFYL